MPHRSRFVLWCTLAGLAVVLPAAPAQADLIVGDIPSTYNWGSANGIAAFSCATTACNVGNAIMSWNGSNNQHPVIATNIFRLKADRFEQIGQAWLKHGFASAADSFCQPCQNPFNSQVIGVGCSDPYGAQQNGIQSDLAPKSEVNPATGYFPWPFNGTPAIPPTTGRRLQAAHADLDPAQNPAAIYFIEAHYVTAGDSANNLNVNNASYRRVNVTPVGPSYQISFSGTHPTQQQKPAIQAWQDLNPAVAITNADVAGDGRLIVGFLATDLGGGTFHYEYAIHNLTSDRAVQAVSVAMAAGAVVTNVGFKDVDYHSNEPGGYALTDWTASTAPGSVSWATQTHAVNPAANALRWGTTYNFRFDANLPPGNVTLTLFKPGTPAAVTIPTPLPPFALSVQGGAPAAIEPSQAHPVALVATNLGSAPDPGSGLLHVSLEGGPFVTSPLVPLGGGAYGGVLPATAPFQTLRWYASMTPLGGGSAITSPPGAPTQAHQTEAVTTVLATIFADDMETVVPGWTVANVMGGSGDGQWDAAPAVPVGGGDRGDPPTAYGGAGKCFLTDNVDGNSDVDDGETRLATPAFDLAGQADARITVQVWYDNALSAGSNDSMSIQISNDNGGTWATMETVSESAGAWVERRYRVAKYVAPTAQVKVRFVASDYAPGHVVEAGVDSLRVEVCPTPPYLGPAGAGNVGATIGGPHAIFTINGSSGGPSRRVEVGLGQPIAFSMLQPPGTLVPAKFIVCGMLGFPPTSNAYALPLGVGDIVLTPCPFDPGNATLFTLADNFPIGICAPLLPSFPAGWGLVLPFGVGFPIDVTLQGVIQDLTSPSGFSVTNGVILRIL
jgi:hypothetical protein